MPTVAAIALDHQARLISINRTATTRALRLWKRMDFDELDSSWADIAPAIIRQSNAAQLAAAKTSDRYTSALSREYGSTQSANMIIPESFVGVDGSGRSMESLLHGAVATTKQAVGAGLSRAQSFEAGAAFLAAMMKTGLADLGRASDMTAAVGKGFTRYVRVINPGACSRCAILAGVSDYGTAFKRHPACKCTSAPVHFNSKTPDGMFEHPQDYFDSLSAAEQDRIFTRGGAEAIRSGADVQDVVSARRGASGITTSRGIGRSTVPNSGRRIERIRIGTAQDGSPITGYVTSEGTYRGSFRSAQNNLGVSSSKAANARYTNTDRVRLMPETIVALTDDPATRQMLLRDAGYLRHRVADQSNNAWIQQHRAARITDRAAAEAFYRSRGIHLG